MTWSNCPDLDADFSFFGEGARRDVGGEGKFCRPPPSISHVHLLFATNCVLPVSSCPPKKKNATVIEVMTDVEVLLDDSSVMDVFAVSSARRKSVEVSERKLTDSDRKLFRKAKELELHS